MSVFTKAAGKKKVATGSKSKKQTIWVAGDPSAKVAQSVHHLVELQAQKKAIDAKMGIHKRMCLTYAKDQYYKAYASTGVPPESPMKVQNADGEAVTFVVQERSQYGVKDQSVEALTELLGPEAADDLVYEETVFSFNRDVLSMDGVMDVLGKHVEAAMKELVETEVLDEDTADSLLDATIRRSFKPGIVSRLGIVAGRSATKIRQVAEALGSSCIQYIKC